MRFQCGARPGKGSYRCVACSKVVMLEKDTDELPVCPKCKKFVWEKI